VRRGKRGDGREERGKRQESINDGFAKSRKSTTNVIPAKSGIQKYQIVTKALDPGLRRGDDFLRDHQ
jgi:hypothetical protein